MIILSAIVESSAKRGPRVDIPSFKPFRTGDKIRIDGIEVEPVHVDHSVPRAKNLGRVPREGKTGSHCRRAGRHEWHRGKED
jgi:hypothetical protein